MGHCRTVGDIREAFRQDQCVGVEWVIPEFFSLPDSADCIFYSPDFSYRGATWYLIVYPNGQAYCASQGWVVLFLCRRLCSPQRAALFGLGIRRADGTTEDFLRDLRLPEGCTHLRVNEFLLRSDLLKRKCQLAPSNSLTVTCTMYSDETPCVRDTILTCCDESKPTSVQFELNEQINEKTGERNICGNTRINNASEISEKKAGSRDRKKGVANVPRDVRRAVKSLLKYFGLCVEGRY